MTAPNANPIQFAVVREDPLTDAQVVRSHAVRRALLVGSGGCTALSLRALFPELELRLVDPNPAQHELIRKKATVLASFADSGELKRCFGVGVSDDPAGLTGCGNFESLFRSLRRFLHEFVMSEAELEMLFSGPAALEQGAARLIASKYWPVAFELHFSEALLNAMFTENATQHAPRGSYPAYFRGVIERELGNRRALDNYFLHHVLLGHYLDGAERLPPYLAGESRLNTTAFEHEVGRIDEVTDLSSFDFIHLSNVMDWMSPADCHALARLLCAQAKSGAVILYRQLNNARDLRGLFAPRFAFDDAVSGELLANDRSLFYNRIEAGVAWNA